MIKESEHIIIKSHQITKDDSKTGRNRGSTKQSENNDQNDNSKSLLINSYFKCKWINSPTKHKEWQNK